MTKTDRSSQATAIPSSISTSREMPSSIPPSIGELIELFSEHLADVEFPDVNASSLEQLSCKVAAAHTAVIELERQLHSAREVFSQAERTLLDKSQSALGYAKVYAREDEELLEALSSIQIGKKKRAEIRNRKPRQSKKAVPATVQTSDIQAALPLSAGA